MQVRATPDQRRDERDDLFTGQLLIAELTMQDASRSTCGIVLNISEGGLAVQCFRSPAHGETVDVGLRLSDSTFYHCAGMVVWQRPGGLAGLQLVSAPSGMVAKVRQQRLTQSRMSDSEELFACRDYASINEFENTLQLFAVSAMALTSSSGVAIVVDYKERMECRASAGSAPEVGSQIDPGTGVSGLSLRTGEVVICQDLWSDPRVNTAAARQLDTRSTIILPISAANGVLGLLEVFSHDTNHFDERHVQQLQPLLKVVTEAIRAKKFDPAPGIKLISTGGTPKANAEPAAETRTPVAPAPNLLVHRSENNYLSAQIADWWALAYERARVYAALNSKHPQAAPVALGISAALLLGVIAVAILTLGHQAKTTTSGIDKKQPVAERSQSNLGARDQGTTAMATPEISFNPPVINQKVGSTFGVDVVMKGAKDISVVPIQVLYDPRRLQVLTVSGGNLLNQDGQASALVQRVDSSAGRITVSISRPSSVSGISGEGTIFTVSFMSKAIGRSKLRIDHAGLRDTSAKTVSVKSSDASVSISASANRPKAETDTGSTDANVIPPPSPTNSRNAEDVGQGWEVQGNDAFPSVHQGWEESPTLNFGLGIASVAGTITPGVNLDVRHQLAVGVPYRF